MRFAAPPLLCEALLAALHAPPLAAVPLASVEDACALIAGRLGSVAREDCSGAGLIAGDARSVQGQPLLYRDFAPADGQVRPLRVLLLGGIHGDELSSVSIVFRWMEQLQYDRYQKFHWRVVPCLNPDGLLARPATRINARGVDLNRNFPSPDWNRDALPYWVKRTGRDRRRYPGPSALSEPESRWLASQIALFSPDVIVSLHAPLGLLDFDGPPEPPSRLGFLRLKQLGTYPGSLGNYAGEFLSIPVFTPELPHAGIMPTGTQIQRIWVDLVEWIDNNIPLPETPPLYLRLADERWLPQVPAAASGGAVLSRSLP